ncbi:dCMP hydroxymethylase [Salmonella phage 19]|nr:dCMP hydroxymethylase [Salmonella phage 19]
MERTRQFDYHVNGNSNFMFTSQGKITLAMDCYFSTSPA